jgi:hypothetical protein
MVQRSRCACSASLDCLVAVSWPCHSSLCRVQRSRQIRRRGLIMRRSHFALTNLVSGLVQ